MFSMVVNSESQDSHQRGNHGQGLKPSQGVNPEQVANPRQRANLEVTNDNMLAQILEAIHSLAPSNAATQSVLLEVVQRLPMSGVQRGKGATSLVCSSSSVVPRTRLLLEPRKVAKGQVTYLHK